MLRLPLLSLAATALLAAGCSGVEDPVTSAAQPIVNGEIDPGHPAAVAVTFTWPKPNGKLGAVGCTGAIFDVEGDTGYVLTAAHCLLPNPDIGKPQPTADRLLVIEGTDIACFLTDPSGASCAGPVHAVVAFEADPGFAAGASPPIADHDFGVLTIGGCGPSTPHVPLLTQPGMAPGSEVDIVGFGEQSYGDPAFTNTEKRHVKSTLAADFDSLTTVGIHQNLTDLGGTCDGDSGGPWLTSVGGVEYVGAVTSVGHHCDVSSIAPRVSSALGGFLAPYLPEPAGSGGAAGSGAVGAGGAGGAGAGGAPVSGNATAVGSDSGCQLGVGRVRSGAFALLALGVLLATGRRRSRR